MDKYEQAVKKYLQNPMYEWTPQELFEEELARFANLLGERREKETCETCRYYGTSSCPLVVNANALQIILNHGPFACHYYRRIVEKEGT